MALIQQSQIRRYRYVIAPAVDLLVEHLIPPGRGNKLKREVIEQWLLAWACALSTHGGCTYAAIEEMLKDDIDRQVAWDNGIFTRTSSGQALTLTEDRYYKVIDKVDEQLGWTLDRHPDLTMDERRTRQTAVYKICDVLVEASIFYENETGLYSVDESGLWAWLKGKYRPLYEGKHASASTDTDESLEALDDQT